MRTTGQPQSSSLKTSTPRAFVINNSLAPLMDGSERNRADLDMARSP